ncbi:MAG: alanine racemase, partial [Desulfobacterota bacterium]|nr:alanine racemase [Thermodesulfobacteriota bacterium]
MKSLNLFPTRAEIDLSALAFNLSQVRNYAGKSKKILAVVKANAYGHGLEMISRELESLGVDFFGVALVKEGVQLRRAGIKRPILVLGGVLPLQAKEVFKFNLTPVIIDAQSAIFLDTEGKKQKQIIPVHIKIDTGMNRLGIRWQEAKDFFTYFKSLKHLKLEGVLSHFSSAHLTDRTSRKFSLEQTKRFREILMVLRKLNPSFPFLVHMANSSAIMEGLGSDEFNMVRAG